MTIMKSTAINSDELFSVKQVANYLNVSERTIYRWIKEGEITCVKIGKRFIRITAAEVNRMVNK